MVEPSKVHVQIKTAIRQRHQGTVTDVILYRDAAYPGREILVPDHWSLKEAGIIGSCQPDPNTVPSVKIVYDFPPAQDVDPLLASGGALYVSHYNIPLAAALQVAALRKNK